MGLKPMKPGGVEIQAESKIKISSTPTSLPEMPGGLYPMRTASFEIDEWRIRNGWPVSVPTFDIRTEALISATGEVFAAREDNTLVTGALLRWLPDEDSWDETTLTWTPYQNNTGSPVVWETSVEYAPVLIHDYEYRVNNERFLVSALNFDSDTRNHMWTDLESTIGGAPGYTVIMVMSPNSSYGNNIDVPFNGLWCPGRATPEGDIFTEDIDPTWASVTLQGGYLYYQTEARPRTRTISISQQLSTNAPMYLAMVFGRPETTFYVGPGPDAIRVASAAAGTSGGVMDNGVVLGRSTGDVLHTADMALLDLGIYSNRLNAAQIRNEFAALSSIYGGDS